MTLHVFVIPIAVAALATPLAAQRAVDDDQASVFSTRYGDREQSSLDEGTSGSRVRLWTSWSHIKPRKAILLILQHGWQP